MIKVYVKKQSNYPVDTPALKKKVKEFLKKKGIVSDSIVNISLVGEEKAKFIARQFLKDNSAHNVLSFTESERKGDFVYPEKDVIYLGEIVVCYPIAVEEAKENEVLIDDRVYELVEHGVRHLLGEHHD